MSQVKSKPEICKKSERILTQAKLREHSAAKMKADSNHHSQRQSTISISGQQ